VLCCFGTNAIQAARLRSDENVLSPISATIAVAPSARAESAQSSPRPASSTTCFVTKQAAQQTNL
jgi:hypothetical protein